MTPQQRQAGQNLAWYLQQAWEAAGLHWTNDNDAEAAAIVDLIVEGMSPDA